MRGAAKIVRRDELTLQLPLSIRCGLRAARPAACADSDWMARSSALLPRGTATVPVRRAANVFGTGKAILAFWGAECQLEYAFRRCHVPTDLVGLVGRVERASSAHQYRNTEALLMSKPLSSSSSPARDTNSRVSLIRRVGDTESRSESHATCRPSPQHETGHGRLLWPALFES